jgi:excisionase family DNA binding protein
MTAMLTNWLENVAPTLTVRPMTAESVPAPVEQGSRWMTLREASAFAKVSVSTLRRAIARNRLTAYRVNSGSHLRVNSEDVDRWLRQAPTQIINA